MDNVCREFERVSALKNTKWNKEKDELETIYIPQVELVEYYESSGKIKFKNFIGVSTGTNIVEFETEIEAIQYAIQARNNFNMSK